LIYDYVAEDEMQIQINSEDALNMLVRTPPPVDDFFYHLK
jgi:hypothetical protein